MKENYNVIIIINGTEVGIGLTQTGKCHVGPRPSSSAPVMMGGEEDPGAAKGGTMTEHRKTRSKKGEVEPSKYAVFENHICSKLESWQGLKQMNFFGKHLFVGVCFVFPESEGQRSASLGAAGK